MLKKLSEPLIPLIPKGYLNNLNKLKLYPSFF